MSSKNPYRDSLKSLDDVALFSPIATAAVDILRKKMACDPVHDEGHILRVVRHAAYFGQGGNLDSIMVAAVLHDLVNLPKNHANRSRASRFSADLALEMLYHRGFLQAESSQKQIIRNAIEAHSWSAQIEPVSLEARAVQDADRIEALGYIGIARLFAAGGVMGRALFNSEDPLALTREPDELKYTLDHYFIKLQKLPATMRTKRGQTEAQRLLARMENFMKDLTDEL